MRSFAHWTPQYVVDRIRVSQFQRRNPDAPWLTESAIHILQSWLRPTDLGVEWGSGRSTIWLAQRVGRLLSIEGTREWYEHVKRRIPATVDLRFCDATDIQADAKYVTAADELEDRSLDFALVDGVAWSRGHCAKLATRKLKAGGLLVFDNAEAYFPRRSRAPAKSPDTHFPDLMPEVQTLLLSWRCIWTTNGVWDTAMWIKP
jgi:hypothetical protein